MSESLLTERILSLVQAEGYRGQHLEELAHALGIGAEEQGDFHAACKALMKTGRVVLGARNALLLAEPPTKLAGVYRGNRRGFGFVVPDTANSHGDLYIPPGASAGAITGDRVSARVLKRGKRQGRMMYEGKVIAVISRAQNRFVGELQRQADRFFVIPDGNILHVPVAVGDPGAKGARPGDQVVIEILEYPRDAKPARGVIVRVLGRHGEPDVDTASIIEQYQLPGDFPDEVLQQAHAAATSFDPAGDSDGREDLTKQIIITIDPADARDFDDAISLEESTDGAVELGVHIADVAHFVPDGSPLDIEARARANSVYLPRTVIPMLPEALSNEVCSLQERQPRFTRSAFITYDAAGRVRSTRFSNSIIRSTKRLSYEQASAALSGKPGRLSAKVVALLRRMEKLARAIRKRRLSEGMLVLDLPEVDLIHDADGRVTDVVPADTSFSHTIIEMFMVEANEAVARFLLQRHVPALRRVHAEPDMDAAENLRRFLSVLGHRLDRQVDRFALQQILDQVRGKPESFAVNLAILRSMQQAEYSPRRIGHYALASRDYTHFTSPIRRYPDLTVHRLLDRFLRNETAGFEGPGERELIDLGSHCSANERRAEAAERELTNVLVLRLLEKHMGAKFPGVVTGVANMGVFVQLDRYLVDGLLRFKDILDDWWEVDPSHGAVLGQRTGHRITVGDRLEVVIARIHVPTRQLELALAEPLRRNPKTSRSRKSREAALPERSSRPAARSRKTGAIQRKKPKKGRRSR